MMVMKMVIVKVIVKVIVMMMVMMMMVLMLRMMMVIVMIIIVFMMMNYHIHEVDDSNNEFHEDVDHRRDVDDYDFSHKDNVHPEDNDDANIELVLDVATGDDHHRHYSHADG